ncbi:hypothetical protein N8K70_14390 [Microbacterium betulae]|uniref:Uncharacterized protein n=1 Tax=Microbacterium betulae TaxID=2981139 RepID=A0AA97FG48_9MICO|nr:hypothetical protein [Microbacterium sp. AB]WOF22568.1 hypothetical protein N8K70_14390 [Microbacterium sp. AB]
MPAVELTVTQTNEGFQFALHGDELLVDAEQRLGDRELFIHVGIGEVQQRDFRLSLESAQRLHSTLGQIVPEMHGIANY